MMRVTVVIENEVEPERVYRSEVSADAMDETVHEVARTLRQMIPAALLAADFTMSVVLDAVEGAA